MTEYRVLKTISMTALLDDGEVCRSALKTAYLELSKDFTYLRGQHISTENNPLLHNFLTEYDFIRDAIKLGYIEKIETEVTYKRGETVLVGGKRGKINAISDKKAIISSAEGCYWGGPFYVEEMMTITQSEIDAAVSRRSITKLNATKCNE